HTVIGVLGTLPFLAFGAYHWWTARKRENRVAVRLGVLLFAAGVLVCGTGFALVQLEGLPQFPTGTVSRSVVYWLHVALPVAAVWLYVKPRRAGRHPHRRREVHQRRHPDDGRILREVPPGHLQRPLPLGPQVQLVQQPGVPVQRPREPAGGEGARRQREGDPVVRRLPRRRPVPQRRVRRPGLRRREPPDGPRRAHLHR